MSSRWIIASLRILLLLLDIIVSHQWQYILQVFVGWFWKTNPLPDPLLTNTQRSSLSFTWKHFPRAHGLNPYHVFRYFYVTNTFAGAIHLKVQINSRSVHNVDGKTPNAINLGAVVSLDITHYSDVIMNTMAPQVTSLMIVYSTVYSDTDQRKHQSSASLAFVRGIRKWSLNSSHKWPVTWKMFPFDDAIISQHTRESHI